MKAVGFVLVLVVFLVGSAAATVPTVLTPFTPAPPLSFPATSAGGATCNDLWEVHPEFEDTCSKIATESGLSGVSALEALNPGIDCANLTAGQLVCIGNTKKTYCADNVYVTRAGDTCNLVRTMYGLASSLLSILNADISCGNGEVALPTGTMICLPATLPASASTSSAACPASRQYVITLSDFLSGCSGLANKLGLTVPQLMQLNPQLVNLAGICVPFLNTVVCKGCSGTICGASLSPAMVNFLNAPTLNQHMCTILTECQGVQTQISGTVGTKDEALTISVSTNSPAVQAAGAAGHAALKGFFGQAGTLSMYPGSTLDLKVYPNKYTASGSSTSTALIEYIANVAVPDGRRKLLGTIRASQSQNPGSKSGSTYGNGGGYSG